MNDQPEIEKKEELTGGGTLVSPAEDKDAAPSMGKNHKDLESSANADTEASNSKADNTGDSENKPGKHGFKPYTLFFAALGLLTVLAWIIPLRPTVSEMERRELDEFPEYESSALFSGEYFRSIENWFSDTFTFRENWISLSDNVKRLFGIQTVAIYGEMPTVDAIPVPSFNAGSDESIENDASEDDSNGIETEEIEAVEPESLEVDLPESEETDIEMPEEESEEWGGIVIDEDELIADRGAKLQIGDAMFVFPGFNKTNAEKYAQRMNKTAELLKGKANFYCIIAPHAVTSMLTREDREKYGFVIEEDAFDYLYGMMSDDVGKVNVISNLQKHNSEYITFRSDPHWTALGAYYAYEVWCEVAGKEPVPLSEYKEIAWTGFLGSYYNTGGQPKALRDNPDTVYCYEPPGDVHLYLDLTNSLLKKGSEISLFVDRSRKKTGDHYITFLSTDAAKATFINNDIDDDSAVLVMKTSFGNPFVYYLTQHYHTVYVIDIRYFNYSLTKFISAQKVDDVIILHNSDLCYSVTGNEKVARLLK